MANAKNDEKILGLKAQIAAKKAQIGKAKRFSPITNCSLELDGVRYNIQVLTKDQLTFTLVRLNSYRLSAKDLAIDDFSLSGYLVTEWISDIKQRIDALNIRENEAALREMEAKLDRLLSDEKKTELEIDEIEALLK